MINISVKGYLFRELKAELKREADLKVLKTKVKVMKKLAELTPVDTGEAQRGWRVVNDAIVNEVEHIEELNNGSSQQAPKRFIERALLTDVVVRPNGIMVKVKR